MSSITKKLIKEKIINPPNFLQYNIHYETITGSISYGVSSGDTDIDIIGFCIPNKEIIFPHLAGIIKNFGNQGKEFKVFQQHHCKFNNKSYDITNYSIVHYFQLLMDNNPNILDSLFSPLECITHITKIGQIVRDNRKLFLSKLAYHRFRGYAFSQLKKAQNKEPVGKRKEIVDKWGVDIKFLYHIVRLLDECEQILETHNIDLQRAKEIMKSIRRGEWSYEEVEQHLKQKEITLARLYETSTLQYSADEEKLKILLLNCLEEHYGNLQDVSSTSNWERFALQEIDGLLNKYRQKLY